MTTDSAEHLDLEAAFSGPAVLTNRFFAVVFDDNLVRLAFMEKANPSRDPRFRAAVVMSASDARELAELLNRIVEVASSPREG